MRKINRANESPPIPLDWLCDGVEDCINGKNLEIQQYKVLANSAEKGRKNFSGRNTTVISGKDEDKSQWKICGAGERQRCIEVSRTRSKSTEITNVYKFDL